MKESNLNLLELLKRGAHFGHKTSRWNPKMKPYIFTVRNDVHILDLEKTKQHLLDAIQFAKNITSGGGTILFVGTKRQVKPLIQTHAEAAKVPYVNVRWLGGTFTNYKTIQKTLRKLEKLESSIAADDFTEKYAKKERLMMQREAEKLSKLFTGISKMKKLPNALFVTDVDHDKIAVTEARKMKIPVIGIVDSNSNPTGIDYPIPANNDSAQTLDLILQYVSAAIQGSAPVTPTGEIKAMDTTKKPLSEEPAKPRVRTVRRSIQQKATSPFHNGTKA